MENNLSDKELHNLYEKFKLVTRAADRPFE